MNVDEAENLFVGNEQEGTINGVLGRADIIAAGNFLEASADVLKSLNNEISVPAENAFSPAPVRISTLMESSAFTASQACASFSYISKVQALRASGRLMVILATPPLTSKSKSWAWLSSVIMNSRQQQIPGDIATSNTLTDKPVDVTS